MPADHSVLMPTAERKTPRAVGDEAYDAAVAFQQVYDLHGDQSVYYEGLHYEG